MERYNTGLSVAIATYNGERYIRKQIQSLLDQTILPKEIVVCDDQSTDKTVEAIEELSQSSTVPITIYRNDQRLGFGENFIKSASLCTTEFVAFCDQDDIWLPEKLQVVLDLMKAGDIALCAHSADLCDEYDCRIGIHPQPIGPGVYTSGSLPPYGVFFGFTCVFRRDLLDLVDSDNRPEDDRDKNVALSHDRWIYFLANSFGKTAVTSASLVLYRQHQSNLYGSGSKAPLLRNLFRLILTHKDYREKYLRLSLGRLNALKTARQPDTPAYTSEDLAKSVRFWSRMHELQADRIATMKIGLLPLRLIGIIKLWIAGAYAPYQATGLGKRALIEDIITCMTQSLPERLWVSASKLLRQYQ